MNRSVESYFVEGCGRCELHGTPQCRVQTWATELAILRSLLLETGLKEECKWGVPCYTYKGKNILILSALKHHVSISFFNGKLLKDKKNLLVSGEKTQAAAGFKFDQMAQIEKHAEDVLNYTLEAIENEKAGKKIVFKSETPDYPTELIEIFKSEPELEAAFKSLTPGRQKGYLIHFTGAKQSATRTSRILKARPLILQGLGLMDKYKAK